MSKGKSLKIVGNGEESLDYSKLNEGKKYTPRPLGNRLIIRVENKDHKTPAGIIIPNKFTTLQNNQMQTVHISKAIVVAKGPDCKEPIEKGDIVSFHPPQALEIWHPENKTDEVMHYITHELNIDAVLE